jgi:translation initiation factor IF-3
MYDQAKKEKGTKHQHHGELREVRFKVKIGDNDMNLKVRRAEQFLKNGDKVKLSVMFRGREIIHPEIGRGLLEKVRGQLEEVGQVEKPPTMEGRFMNMIMGPPTAKPRPASAPKPAATAAPKPEASATPKPETKVAAEG